MSDDEAHDTFTAIRFADNGGQKLKHSKTIKQALRLVKRESRQKLEPQLPPHSGLIV